MRANQLSFGLALRNLYSTARVLTALGAIVPGALLVIPSAEAVTLAPHRAHYVLSKHPGSTDSTVSSVRGRLELEFEASCDGWRMEQSLGFRMLDTEGTTLEHVAHLSAFESRNGKDYWFNTRSYENRELLEELAGAAHLETPGLSGEARITKPESTRLPLPAGTVFPMSHIRDLVSHAELGNQHVRRVVFDGSTQEKPFEISAFIGRSSVSDEHAREGISPQHVWPMRLAYFNVGAVQPSPEFEMSLELYENGVAGDMIYDYGALSMNVELQRVELLPSPICPAAPR